MWRPRFNWLGKGNVPSIFASLALSALLLVAVAGVAEASWCPLDGSSGIVAASASPVGSLIRQAVGQSVSLLMMAVAIIIAVPVLIAGVALLVGYALSRAARRHEKPRHMPRGNMPTAALRRAS